MNGDVTTSTAPTGPADVPGQVFEAFLEALMSAGVSAELVARLRKTLIDEKTFTDGRLSAAIFGEEVAP